MSIRAAVSVPSRVAAHRVGHRDRVALGVHADRLFAVERQPHRPAGQARQQRGLRLDRHVLLAAEGAAVGTSSTKSRSSGSPSTERHLAPVVEDALALACRGAAGRRASGTASAALRLEEQVLDALGAPGAGHDVRASRPAPHRRRRARVRRRESTFSCFGLTLRRARLDRASAGSSTGGSTSYSTSHQRGRLARRVRGVSAATAASTSPTERTSSPSATKHGQSL